MSSAGYSPLSVLTSVPTLMGAEPLNPYQASLPPDELREGESPPEATVKLFSAFSVGLATFLGSLFAGSILMGINYRRLGKKAESTAMILAGLLATSFVIACGAFLPAAIPSLLYTGVQVILAVCAFRVLQTHLINSHLKAGGRLASAWWTVPVAVISIFPILAIAFALEGAIQLSLGSRIAVGRDEVYISGSATEEDGRWLAEKLTEAEWFGGDGATALMHRSGDRYTISLMVANESTSDPETIQFFTDFGNHVADERLGHPLEMRVIDESYSVKQKIPVP